MPRLTPMLLHIVPEEDIEHFTLAGMFPAGQVFALHLPLRTLSHLRIEPDTPAPPRLLAQVQFTERELDLVRPLYQHYPQFVPYEVMWTCFNRGFAHLNERTLATARQHLEAARLEEGLWDAEMRPMRNIVTRNRAKLREVGLEVANLLATGYLLTKHPKW
ncbi:MAG: hypothetical protein ACRDIV_24490 [Ktedonobacteraceae bacterium]